MNSIIESPISRTSSVTMRRLVTQNNDAEQSPLPLLFVLLDFGVVSYSDPNE